MKNFARKLSAIALCTVFASMQVTAATMTGDVGLGSGLGGANITGHTGAYDGFTTGNGSATVNVSGDAHIKWGNLNVGSGETLNFNGTTGANATVVNSVTNGMSQIYGTITANDGVAKLIISNPNGMLFDGAKFVTTGDVSLTTQGLNPIFDASGKITGFESVGIAGATSAVEGMTEYSVVITNGSDFQIGGEFNITAPSINVIQSAIQAGKGVKFITTDGQNYLVRPVIADEEKAERQNEVRLEAVQINGNVEIISDRGILNTVNGGTINGNLDITSDGNVALNYSNNGEQLHITGNANVANDGRVSYLRNAKVDGDLDMSNSGGFLEINNVEVGKDANLTTTVETNEGVKHFIHVVGENKVAGNMNINSAHNIHIGGYNTDSETDTPSDLRKEGSLTVGGDLTAQAKQGSIAVTVDTAAKNVKMGAGLNIISDGKAAITADTYEFAANHYIGGLNDENQLINVMEEYIPMPTKGDYSYLNIAGGDVNKILTSKYGHVRIKSNGDMNVNGVNAPKVNLTADQANITIKDDVHADVIKVGGETKKLKVEFPERDYTLKYTDIKDNTVVTINPNDEITYEITDGKGGHNDGTQILGQNTYLVGPGQPDVPPVDPDDPTPPVDPVDPDPTVPTPDDNDNVKILRGYERDQIGDAINANEVYTPVAFAADLDEEIDTGIRKNVDGSVTVVRPFTPSK